MEAIERSVATQAACPVVTKSARQLREAGSVAIDRLDCLLAPIGKPVGDDEAIDWTIARNLLSGENLYVPHQAVTMDRTILAPRFWQSSDGLASGNNQTEAILHGLLERVERDALTLWEASRAFRRYRKRIATDSASPALADLADRIARADMQIALFEITTEFGIPAACALLGPQDLEASYLRHVDVTLGAGAGLTLEAAAIRAVTEAVQSRMTFIAGARDDLMPDLYQKPLSEENRASFRQPKSVQLTNNNPQNVATTEQALAYILSQLQIGGQKRLYAVELAPAWLPVSVVKVIAADLENPEGERRSRYGARALSRALL